MHAIVGVTHGDMCPNNIVVHMDETGNATATLIDFGGAIISEVFDICSLCLAFPSLPQPNPPFTPGIVIDCC